MSEPGYSKITEYNTSDEPERRKTQVDNEIVDLRRNISTVQDFVNSLGHRLSPVLIVDDSVDKVVASEMSEPRMQLVPIAEELRDFNYQLAATILRLRSILDRLEV